MKKPLNKMEPFAAWKVHLAVKDHFWSNYDDKRFPFAFKDKYKYGNAVKMPRKYFDGEDRKHFLKEMFEAVADRWSKPEFIALSVANAITGHKKCGMPYGMEEIEVFHEWIARQSKISYTFGEDLKAIENWNKYLMSKNNHPVEVRLFMGGHIKIETVAILDIMSPFLTNLRGDLIIGDTCRTIQRYRPFLLMNNLDTKKLHLKHETLINNIAS